MITIKNTQHYLLLCIILLCSVLQAFPQTSSKEITVTGVVLDNITNEPLIGVNVSVKNVPGLGSITDINGRYVIKVEPYSRLIFSYVGFETLEILVKNQSKVDVKMKEAEASVLDEVVITGTGVQKKISVTGAISAVNVDELKKTSSSSIVNSLAGNVAGVLAMQTSGQPGLNTSEFWIRGISTFGASNSALVLVDGFERDMNDLSVEDIESFQVLKDATETAIYGSRGANGVVLITTKHGKASKISISAKVETSYNTRTVTPDYVDGSTYARMLNEARITRNQTPMYSEDELFILDHNLDPDLLPNVDWQDVVLKDGAMSYKASLNLQGGGTNTRYFVSASYIDEQGMYKTDETLKKDYNTNANVRRWNYRMNADIDITKTTLLKVGISGMLKKRNDAGKGSNIIWNSLNGYNPIATPVRYSTGYFPAVPEFVSNIRDNPWVATTQTGFRQNWSNQMQTNITLEQKLDFVAKGLRFVGRFGFDTNNTSYIYKFKEPERWQAERFRDSNGELVFHRLNEEVKMTQSSGGDGDRKEFFEAELHYDRIFKDHHLNGTLKYNQDSKIQTYNLGTDLKTSIPRRHQGFAGRAAYNWKYRYFFNFNFGYNGSENFASKYRFGFFPSVSTAWNIAEETFIKEHMKWLNMFKVRYSWGKVGSDGTGERFPFIYTIGANGSYQWSDFGVSNYYGGITYTQVASPNISWEVATKNDLGLDLSICNDKFSLTIDYFHEKREGIFVTRSYLPQTVGILSSANPKANVGGVLSKGWDGNFAYKQSLGKINFTVRGNATYSKNEILDYDESYKDYPYLYNRGYQVNQSRGYIALGLFKDWNDIRNSPKQSFGNGELAPGDIKYKDVNGDGIINNNDQVPIGNTNTPRFIYGFGISASWKGLDTSVHFQGAGKSSVLISGSNVKAFSAGSWGNIMADLLGNNRWISKEISGDPSTEDPNASYPRLEYGNNNGNNRQPSTFWMRNMAYLRLKTIEIGYTLPKQIVNKIHFNSIRLFFLGNNILTFSDFKAWDPEMGSYNGSEYPIAKSFTIGLNVSL